MIQEKTVVSTTETPPTGPARFLAPAAVGLAILLVVGGIALGLRKNDDDQVANLPEFSPVYVTPSDSNPSGNTTTPSTEPTPTPTTNSSATTTSSAPAKQVTTQKASQQVATNSTKKNNVATTGSGQSQSLPDYQPQFALPAYTPQSALPAYTPQFSEPTPSPAKQTISVRLVTPGHSYSVEVKPGATILQVLQAAARAGLSYRTQTFTGLGEKVVELNGVTEGDNKFWLYDINGHFATKGISVQTVQESDTINWKLS